MTERVKDAIITRNGIEVSRELLDGCVREVRVYPDGTVEVSWEFDEGNSPCSI